MHGWNGSMKIKPIASSPVHQTCVLSHHIGEMKNMSLPGTVTCLSNIARFISITVKQIIPTIKSVNIWQSKLIWIIYQRINRYELKVVCWIAISNMPFTRTIIYHINLRIKILGKCNIFSRVLLIHEIIVFSSLIETNSLYQDVCTRCNG